MPKPWWEELIRTYACHPSIVYVKQFATFPELWNACPRGDWLLWLAARIVPDRKQLVKCACACARLVLPIMGDDPEIVNVINAGEGFARDEATIDNIRNAFPTFSRAVPRTHT